MILYAIAIAAMVAIFEWAGGYDHARARPLWISGAIILGAVAIAGVGAWGAFARRGSMNGPKSFVLALVSMLLPAAAFFWLTAWHGTYAEPAQKLGWRCLGLTLSMGAALLASLVAVRYRTVAVQPVLQGVAAGVVASALAGVLVDAWCPLTNTSHVLNGHLVPMLLLGGLGAACGWRLLAVRQAKRA